MSFLHDIKAIKHALDPNLHHVCYKRRFVEKLDRHQTRSPLSRCLSDFLQLKLLFQD